MFRLLRTVALFLAIAAGAFFAARDAHAQTSGMYFCAEVGPGDTCAQWVNAVEGIASLEQVGVTSDAIRDSMVFGFGAVTTFFVIGLGIGAAQKGVRTTAEN